MKADQFEESMALGLDELLPYLLNNDLGLDQPMILDACLYNKTYEPPAVFGPAEFLVDPTCAIQSLDEEAGERQVSQHFLLARMMAQCETDLPISTMNKALRKDDFELGGDAFEPGHRFRRVAGSLGSHIRLHPELEAPFERLQNRRIAVYCPAKYFLFIESASVNPRSIPSPIIELRRAKSCKDGNEVRPNIPRSFDCNLSQFPSQEPPGHSNFWIAPFP